DGESEKKLDNSLLLGLLTLSAGGALLLHAHGPLAALAAGVVLRRFDPGEEDDELKDELEELGEGDEDEEEDPAPLPLPQWLLDFKDGLQDRVAAGLAFVTGGLLSVAAPECLSWVVLLAVLAARPAASSGTLLAGGSLRFKFGDVI